MKRPALTPKDLLKKARTACVSARVLLDLGDFDGAANRAYYAIFDAARAALLASGVATTQDFIRTHSGLIGAFGQSLVKSGRVPRELGRLLNRAHEIRLIADYQGDVLEQDEATDMVKHAETFLAMIDAELMLLESK